MLCDALSLIIAFFAMRRGDEIFICTTHTHGILQSQMVLEHANHFLLFVAAQNTDSTHQGHFFSLAWVARSHVKIGSWIQRFENIHICVLQTAHVRHTSDVARYLHVQALYLLMHARLYN